MLCLYSDDKTTAHYIRKNLWWEVDLLCLMRMLGNYKFVPFNNFRETNAANAANPF